MAAYLQNFYTAVRGRIAAIWTDVPADGIWEDEHVQMVPWAELTPPYAVIVGSKWGEGDWGANNLSYEGSVEIYRVQQIDGPSGSLITNLEAMRDDFRVNELSSGQVLNITDILWDQTLEPNKVFSDKGYTHRAGVIILDVVVGETI